MPQVSYTTNTSSTGTLDVALSAVNDAPVALSDALTASNGAAVTYTAAQLLGNDTDAEGNTLTIAGVSSGTDGTVVLNADGTVTFTPNANFSGSANFTYTATDGTLTSNTAKVTVTVAAADNLAPTAVSLDNAIASLAENTDTSGRIKLADIGVSDDGAGTNSLSLSGPDKGNFEILGSALYLKAGVKLDYESQKTHAVTVSAADAGVSGSSAVSRSFTLVVNNVDEVAPRISSGAEASIAEASGAGQVIYTAASTDTVDYVSGATRYSLKADAGDAAAFRIDPVTGQVRLLGNPLYEAKSSYSFTVVATDAAGNASEKTVSLAVIAKPAAPVVPVASKAPEKDQSSTVSKPAGVGGSGGAQDKGKVSPEMVDAHAAASTPAVERSEQGGDNAPAWQSLGGAGGVARGDSVQLPTAPTAAGRDAQAQARPEGETGFKVAIATERDSAEDGSGAAALKLFRGIPDQRYEANAREILYVIPTDSFVHTNPRATVQLTALQVDGRPIPAWLRFDAKKGEFKGIPPAQFKGEIAIKVIAKDDAGTQVETAFSIRVGDVNEKIVLRGKPSLTSQLRAHGTGGLESQRDRFIRHARSLAQSRAA